MSESTDSTLKTFDGTPIAASLFLRHIGEHAAKKGYLTLLLRSYYVSKHDQIIVASADLLLKQLRCQSCGCTTVCHNLFGVP